MVFISLCFLYWLHRPQLLSGTLLAARDFGDSDQIFVEAKPGHHAVTQTVSQRLVVVKHSLNFTGSKLVLIDTPGLNESIQRDLDHMRGLYQTLQRVDGISAIVLHTD